MPSDHKPRIIFNDDNWLTLRRGIPQPHTPDKVRLAIDHLRKTQVDWLCWSLNSGGLAFSWRSDVMENMFDEFCQADKNKSSVETDYANIAALDQANPENLMLSLYQQGIDYLPLLVEQSREAGICFIGSFRMNDCHHKSCPEGKLAGEFWRKHPEYRLWEITEAKTYYNAVLNYEIPEVRERMLAAISEVLERYDMDGIELDWTRNHYALPPSQAWAKRQIMTRFTQQIRKRVDDASRVRGHKIKLVLRMTHDSGCLRQAGLDAWTWCRDQLIDVLVTSCHVNDYNVDVSDWRDLCRQNDVWYYHSVEAGPADNAPAHNHVVPETVDETVLRMRAAAQNILAQDTDGVYLFNYTCKLSGSTRQHTPETLVQQAAILSQIGQLDSLCHTSKQYTFWKQLPLQLESWRPAEHHQTLRFYVRDSALADEKGKATLRFRQATENSPHISRVIQEPPQSLRVGWVNYYLNGCMLDPKRFIHALCPAGKIDSGFELGPHEQIEIQLAPGELKPGKNTLAFHIPKTPEEQDPYVYIHQFTVDTNRSI